MSEPSLIEVCTDCLLAGGSGLAVSCPTTDCRALQEDGNDE